MPTDTAVLDATIELLTNRVVERVCSAARDAFERIGFCELDAYRAEGMTAWNEVERDVRHLLRELLNTQAGREATNRRPANDDPGDIF